MLYDWIDPMVQQGTWRKKNWIIAKLSKDYRNEIKKQQMYELKWYIKGKSSSEEKKFNLLLHQTLFSGWASRIKHIPMPTCHSFGCICK